MNLSISLCLPPPPPFLSLSVLARVPDSFVSFMALIYHLHVTHHFYAIYEQLTKKASIFMIIIPFNFFVREKR